MDLFGARSFPFLTRRNYLNEMRYLLPWSLVAALIEGQFGAIVVSKSFGGGELLIAIATATPMASLMFSLFWGEHESKERKREWEAFRFREEVAPGYFVNIVIYSSSPMSVTTNMDAWFPPYEKGKVSESVQRRTLHER